MRPEALFPLFAPLASLKGLGPKLAPLVERAAGGALVRDLAFLQPASLLHRRLATVAEVQEGELVTLAVRIEQHLPGGGGGRPYRVRCADETGWVFATFFGGVGGAHLMKGWPVGEARVISGEAHRYGVELQLKNPLIALPDAAADAFPEVEAVYPTTAGLPVRTLRRFALEALERAPDLAEWQDAAWIARQGWPTWRAALAALHAPACEADLDPQASARARLAYDELLAHQLAMASRKRSRGDEPGPVIVESDLSRRAQAALPYRLTGAQLRTLSEIGGDLASGRRMTRLVQGDVGAGKTVVAMLAAADVAASGRQTALMAPTEILARQHYETVVGPLAAVGVRAELLTGRDKGAGRAEKLAGLASGGATVAIGTHALFQKDVVFSDLALAVVDEQHRFGVNERRRLQEKGAAVHLLALSATPHPAHAGADRLRRPRRLAARREAPWPQARGHHRGAHHAPAGDRRAAEEGGGRRRAGLLDLPAGGGERGLRRHRRRQSRRGAARRAGPRGRPRPRPTTGAGEGRGDGRLRRRGAQGAGGHHRGRGGRQRAQRHHHGDRARRALRPWPSCTSCAAGWVGARRPAPASCSTTRRSRSLARRGWRSCATPRTASPSPSATWSCAAAAT